MWRVLFWLLWGSAALWEALLHLLEWRYLKGKTGLPLDLKETTFLPSFKWDRSVAYAKERLKVSLGETLTNYALYALIVIWGVPILIDEYLMLKIRAPLLASGLLGASMALLFWICSLPWSWIKVFDVERTFGFSRVTKKTFFRDQAIKLILMSLVSFGGLGCFALLFKSPLWPLYLAIALILFEIVAMFILPFVIIPMFFKLTPLAQGEVAEKLESFLAEMGLKNTGIYVADASKRTLHSNAFVSGLGKAKKIVLFDTLLSSLTPDEVCAVFGHELGHWISRHAIKRMGLLWAAQIILILLAYIMFNAGFGQSFHAQSPQTFAVYAFLFLNMLVTLFFQPLILSVSRRQELEADFFAASRLGGHQMAQALSKISTSNLGWLPSHPLYEMWYLTHPPIYERIKALKDIS